jgi:hypothetical protein
MGIARRCRKLSQDKELRSDARSGFFPGGEKRRTMESRTKGPLVGGWEESSLTLRVGVRRSDEEGPVGRESLTDEGSFSPAGVAWGRIAGGWRCKDRGSC